MSGFSDEKTLYEWEARTDFLVSSKKILALSWMPRSCWLWVPAPLMPDVALVELPPINLEGKERE